MPTLSMEPGRLTTRNIARRKRAGNKISHEFYGSSRINLFLLDPCQSVRSVAHCGSVLRQFFHCQEQVVRLRQDRVFQDRLVGDEDVHRGHAADRRIEVRRTARRRCGRRSPRRSPSSACLRRRRERGWFLQPMRRSCPSRTDSSVRRSINSTFTPCSRSSFCAACRARGTTAP